MPTFHNNDENVNPSIHGVALRIAKVTEPSTIVQGKTSPTNRTPQFLVKAFWYYQGNGKLTH